MNRTFQQSYHIPGTLTANITITFTAHADISLQHVSAVASNASSANLIVGTAADTDGYIAATDIGDSGTPVEIGPSGMAGAIAGGHSPHIKKGTVVVVTLDFDGSSGTAAQNVTLVLTFLEG